MFASVGIAFHLLAVFAPPLAFQARGTVGASPSVQSLTAVTSPYSQFLYLDRGYAFFAPDPGPSHLIRYTVWDSGENPTAYTIPDRERHWPRLEYHRHFMLSEFLYQSYSAAPPPGPLTQFTPDEYAELQASRTRFEAIRDSVLRHLEQKHAGQTVKLSLVTHHLPTFLDVTQQGIELRDPRLYETLIDTPIPNLSERPIGVESMMPRDPWDGVRRGNATPRAAPAVEPFAPAPPQGDRP